jgi:ribonuclease P/MRP protein subunit RPP40
MLFADDLKLLGCADDINSIKEDLKKLEEWENIWLLKFNPTKCKVMHINMNDNKKETYTLDGVVLDKVDSETDLGVSVSSDLDWRENIYSCIKEANRMIAWISRIIVNKDKFVMLNIYKTLIRPRLEYCVQLWNPKACHGNWSIILDLESVQRKFTRLINGIGILPYSKRLNELKLTTLAERRVRGDLIETFKIVNGLVDYGQNVFRLSRSGSNIVSKSYKNGPVNSKVKN